MTPGDSPNVLVAMNPAALKANLRDLSPGSTVIVNVDTFDTRNLDKAGYEANPLRDHSLETFSVYEVPMTSITIEATEGLGVKPRDAERSKNFFALGLICWMYDRPTQPLVDWIDKRFAGNAAGAVGQPRARSRPATTSARPPSCSTTRTRSSPAPLPARHVPQHHRERRAGLRPGRRPSQKAKLPLVYASYPITPASDILHELSRHKNFGVKTLQAEDEIAAAGAAIGAAFAGRWRDRNERPGRRPQGGGASASPSALELPLVLVDVQRGGPSTGLPTKTEQADLMLAMYGRHGEAPLPIVAAQVAERLLRRRVRSGAPRGEVPHPGDPAHRRLPRQRRPSRGCCPPRTRCPTSRCRSRPSRTTATSSGPYLRDPETLARPWAIPGTPGLMHRIGGLEKEEGTGNVSYEPENHELMTHLRAQKIAGIARDMPASSSTTPEEGADVVVLSWGSTWGVRVGGAPHPGARTGVIARVHLRHLNPFPAELGDILRTLPAGDRARDEPGPAVAPVRAEYLVDAEHHEGAGRAVPIRRARRPHPGADGR